jgi:hypothetical protein
LLSLKTQFPINERTEPEQLLEAIRVWIAGSPHYTLAPVMKAQTTLSDEGRHEALGERLLTTSIIQHGKHFCGAQLEKRDNEGRTWLTEVTGCRRDDAFWVSVLLHVDSELPVERLDQGRRPHILKTIMTNIGGGLDGALQVSDAPHYLGEGDIELAARLIAGEAACNMPIVFISMTATGRLHVDPKQLAQWLSGMAHVVVEPSRQFSVRLARATYNENAYGGAVAIYWPDGIGKWTFLPRLDDEEAAQVMQRSISRKVRQSLLSQRTLQDCTWSYVQELRSRQRVQELLESGTAKIEEFVNAFDSEHASRQARIDELEAENRRLRHRRPDYAPRIEQDGSDRPLQLASGLEDLYQGERNAILMDLVHAALNSVEKDTRRYEVLTDLAARNALDSEAGEITERIKVLLKGYSSMNGSLRSDLEALGFEINEEGKHHKLVFRGAERFHIVLSKTSSDRRAGKNAASLIKRLLF